MSRKIAIATITLCAAALLAQPGSAAALWGHHLETLPKDVQLGIAGSIKLEADVGGAECRFPLRAQLIARTARGRATTQPAAGEAPRCKGLGSYALCRIQAFSPQAPSWAFRNTIVQSKELFYDGGEVTVEEGLPEEAILIRSRSLTVRSRGVFCPAGTITIAPGTVAALPEGGPDTIANVVLNGVLVAQAPARASLPLSEKMTVSGTLQVADPAQRDTYSIGNRGE